MPARKSPTRSKRNVVLLVEADVLVRFALADFMRACDVTVIEAANADDAKAILVAWSEVGVLMSDTQLAGEGSGFTLAQWVRRHRPEIEIVLTASVPGKAQAAAAFTARFPDCNPPCDAPALAAKLNAMLAERKRRTRQQPRTVVMKPARRKRMQ